MLSRWAVLKCRFADDPEPELVPPQDYLDLFTGSGAGSHNLTDYFRDMSHGRLDLTGSKVFGWFVVPQRREDYVAGATSPVPPVVNRSGLMKACEKAAKDGGVDLADFDGHVVTMNGAVDLFGYAGGMSAFCSSDNLKPSLVAQEMGHGYGLEHSRRDGSSEDYQDPYDTMSTQNALMAPDPRWALIGPGLNAANMRGRGWLDEARVWKPGPGDVTATITLRPLHRPDLPGLLAAELPGGELVELRIPAGWDGALKNACVLVHQFYGNQSYLMTGSAGTAALGPGDEYRLGVLGGAGVHTRMRVQSIDEGPESAVLLLEHSFTVVPEYVPWPWPLGRHGGAEKVVSGLLVGGRFTPVPPRVPEFELMRPLAQYFLADEIDDVGVRVAARRVALENLVNVGQQALQGLDPLRVPAPAGTQEQ